jgi:hypothetical protein
MKSKKAHHKQSISVQNLETQKLAETIKEKLVRHQEWEFKDQLTKGSFITFWGKTHQKLAQWNYTRWEVKQLHHHQQKKDHQNLSKR